jgi:hypothetical protein
VVPAQRGGARGEIRARNRHRYTVWCSWTGIGVVV